MKAQGKNEIQLKSSDLLRLFAIAIIGLFPWFCQAERWTDLEQVANSVIQIDEDSVESLPEGIKATWMASSSPASADEFTSILNCQSFEVQHVSRAHIFTELQPGSRFRRGPTNSYNDDRSQRTLGSGHIYPTWGSREGILLRSVCGQRVEGWTKAMRAATSSPSTCPNAGPSWLSRIACSPLPAIVADFGVLAIRIDQVQAACSISKENIYSGIALQLRKIDECPGDACSRLLIHLALDTLTDDLASAAIGKPCVALAAKVAEEQRAETKRTVLAGVTAEYMRCARSAISLLDDNVSPATEVAVAVNQQCRSTLTARNGDDEIAGVVVVALEKELMKNNILLIFQKRAALRLQQGRQRPPARKSVGVIPMT